MSKGRWSSHVRRIWISPMKTLRSSGRRLRSSVRNISKAVYGCLWLLEGSESGICEARPHNLLNLRLMPLHEGFRWLSRAPRARNSWRFWRFQTGHLSRKAVRRAAAKGCSPRQAVRRERASTKWETSAWDGQVHGGGQHRELHRGWKEILTHSLTHSLTY